MAATKGKSKSTQADQPHLPMTSVRRKIGTVERAIAKSIKAAEHLQDMDGAAVALLRSAARNVDACTANSDRHTHAMAVARMSELLTKLHLEPDSRGEGVKEKSAWDRIVEELGSTESGDAKI